MGRRALGKKIRFEVFKRDSFTCQYCGSKAPDVVLNCDHINPVAKGGTDEITNLITACWECNSGKSDRKLDDKTVLAKQQEQLAQMEERRQQLAMMMEWHRGLMQLDDEAVDQVADLWSDQVGFDLTDSGRKSVKTLIRKFGLPDLLEAIKISVDSYVTVDEEGKTTHDSAETAFKKLGGICVNSRRDSLNPDFKRLLYIRGIARNRFHLSGSAREHICLKLLEQANACGATVESLQDFAKAAANWSDFEDELKSFIESEGTSGM